MLERDVGLFSMVTQVINTLHLLERHDIARTPVALFGRDIAYFDPDGHEGRTTVWEYYFEPLVKAWPAERVLAILGDRPLDLVASRRLFQERARGARVFPQDLHRVPPLTTPDLVNLKALAKTPATAHWQWTDDFMPSVDGRAFDRLPNRDETALLLRKWIRPRSYIVAKVDEFHSDELHGRYVIGVHVRGTDSRAGPTRSSEFSLEPFFRAVDARIAEVGRSACRVLLATDDQAYVDSFRDRYGDLCVSYDAVRSRADDAPRGKGPTGQGMPGFLTSGDGRAVLNGEGVVVEFSLLCRSDYLVHNQSSVSGVARCVVADSLSV